MEVHVSIQLKAIEGFYDHFLAIRGQFQSILKNFQAPKFLGKVVQEIQPKNFNFFRTRLGLIQISYFGPFGQNKCMKVPVSIQLKAIKGIYDHFLIIRDHFESILKNFQAQNILGKSGSRNFTENFLTFSDTFRVDSSENDPLWLENGRKPPLLLSIGLKHGLSCICFAQKGQIG